MGTDLFSASHKGLQNFMEPKQLLEFQSEKAAELADWLTILYDLDFVIESTRRLHAILGISPDDAVLCRSLWDSALVAYVRCFTGGKRKIRLDPSLFEHLPGEPIETHQCYKDTRDKHIAHPVNAFEEVTVGVILSDNDDVLGVGHLYARRLCDEKEGVKQLDRMAQIAKKYAQEKIRDLEQVVLAQLKKLDKDSLKKLKALRITPQGGAQAARKPK